MKIQVLLIHGGMTFKSKRDYLEWVKTRDISIRTKNKWTGDYLENKLGKKYEVIKPSMPLKENAKYEDWKICFRRILPLLNKKIILIGSSLGGIFLAKYLSENKIDKDIIATYLIAPPFDNSLSSEDLCGGFKLKSNLSLLEKNSPKTRLFFSENDEVVPKEHAKKYSNKLPSAKIYIMKGKNGHFNVEKFPEIIKMIKKDNN